MRLLVDASVVLRWFVDQPDSHSAQRWLERFAVDANLFAAPDLLRFEVLGGLARLQPRRDPAWSRRCFARFDRLGIATFPTTLELMTRALELSSEIRMGGYDAVYLAHAEALGVPWLTADRKVLRRLARDPRIRSVDAG